MRDRADAATSEVSAEDFADIVAATRGFIRTAVVPREQEIADADAPRRHVSFRPSLVERESTLG